MMGELQMAPWYNKEPKGIDEWAGGLMPFCNKDERNVPDSAFSTIMSSPKKAFITGITGQDGSFAAELLLSKGYAVHGLVRRQREPNYHNLRGILSRVKLHEGDIADATSVSQIIKEIKPDEIYHYAAMSFIPYGLSAPAYTVSTNTIGTLNILEAVRIHAPHASVLNAATSEMFGHPKKSPQTLETPFNPASPYAISKVAAFHIVNYYRNTYGIQAVNAISFNHESERRGTQFVTRKIAMAAASKKPVFLGDLDAERDWGWAPEFVEGHYQYLQRGMKYPALIFATGEVHSVEEFAERAYGIAGLEWSQYVKIDDSLKRVKTEPQTLMGDISVTQKAIGWTPKIKFNEIVEKMMHAETFLEP